MSSPYPTPLLFTAWGFRRSANAWDGAQFLADRAKQVKAKTVAVQLGTDDKSGIPWTTAAEAGTLRANGLRVVVWGVADPPAVKVELNRLNAIVGDWFPQVEGTDQLQRVVDAARVGLRPQAIVTNYGGAGTPEEISKLRAAGVKAVFVECYTEAGPAYANLDTMMWQGRQYGWHDGELFPVLSTYRDELPASFQHTEEMNRGYGLYLSEPMSPQQWEAWGSYKPPPKPAPTPPVIPDPGTVRVGASKVLHTWLDPYLAQGRPQHASIIRITDRLLKLTSAQQRELNEALLIAELDRVGSPRT